MRQLRKWVWEIFGFSRRETNAFLIMIPLLLLAVFSQPVYNWLRPVRAPDYSREARILDSLEILLTKTVEGAKPSDQPVVKGKRMFNPNLESVEGFVELGINESVARRIVNYRNKGGKFAVRTDLRKIYGLDSLTYHDLEPYLLLPRQIEPEPKKSALPVEPEAIVSFDLNTCDSIRLVELKGIGPKLSSRIIRYRNALGGFVNSDQLYEVYGLDSAVVDLLKERTHISSGYEPDPIDLNAATEAELAGHPYISRSMARAIVAYRKQHGQFLTVEGIQRIKLVDVNTFLKLQPYLNVRPLPEKTEEP